jgi:hypothetical protein
MMMTHDDPKSTQILLSLSETIEFLDISCFFFLFEFKKDQATRMMRSAAFPRSFGSQPQVKIWGALASPT